MQTATPEVWELRGVHLLQAVFLVIALFGLDGPFVSMHPVRQNFTFDVAQHVFHEGWPAVLAPRASFTQQTTPNALLAPLPNPAPRVTMVHLEFPFHGLFGWPFAAVFKGHDRAVARLVSVAFALLSIALFHRVARHWLDPWPALLGCALWTTAPLIVHFGQVPTPDILATTGMAAAFLFALRGNVAASSGAFLFMLLAKLSVIVYGLPILVALVLAKECRSARQFVRLSLAWGLGPLACLLAWFSLDRHSPPESWSVFGGYQPGGYGHTRLADILHPAFYQLPVLYVFPFGLGVLGVAGWVFASRDGARRMDPWLKAAIAVAIACNYVFERIVWIESQYTVPVLFWVILAASFGFPPLLEKCRASKPWRMALAGGAVAHLALVCVGVLFLKASRVHNLPDIQAAARMTPPDARVVVYAASTSQPPPMWLNRNTLQLEPFVTPAASDLEALAKQLRAFRGAGFDYLMVFDVEAKHSLNPFHRGVTLYTMDTTSLASPLRRFLDGRFREIYAGDHVVLYSLAARS